MTTENPFSANDADRHQIWEVLIRRDSAFFLQGDWSLVADDYVEDDFLGIDAGGDADPDQWTIGYPSLGDYRDAAIAGRLQQSEFAEDLEAAWFRCQSLPRIDIAGNRAFAHKWISGEIQRTNGNPPLRLSWRSVFFMRKVGGAWKITGFVGYLPGTQV